MQGMGMHSIRMNPAIPFINGGISASMKSGQPHRTNGHEVVYSLRLYNLL